MDEVKTWSPFATVYDPLESGSIDRTDVEPHDRAIVRAIYSKYKPDPTLINDPSKTLFIAHLNLETTEETLKEYFSYYGKLRNCRIVRDIVTGFSKGYAFIEYESEYDALEARSKGHRSVIDDKEIFVDYELERKLPGWKPRRLGGGFGGKRESGQLRFGGRDRPFKKPYELYYEEDRHKINNESQRFSRGSLENSDRRKYTYHKRNFDDSRSSRRDRHSHRDRYQDRREYNNPDRKGKDRHNSIERKGRF